MLALAPAAVRLERAAAGSDGAARPVGRSAATEGVRAVSPNGVLGDPAGATAEHGRRLLAALVDDLTAAVGWPCGVLRPCITIIN